MNAPLAREQHHAQLILQILLGLPVPNGALAGVDWDLLIRIAQSNAVLLRLAARLQSVSPWLPRRFTLAAEGERSRADAAVAVLRSVLRYSRRHQIEWLLPKAAQRYPDLGDDLDLLVVSPDPRAGDLMLEGLRVIRRRRTLAHRLGGSVVFWVPDAGWMVDVHHGCLGAAGLHSDYVRALAGRARVAVIEGTSFPVPAPEDQLVVQGLEKVAGRRAFHLCDVLQTIRIVRDGSLDWEYVDVTTRALGARAGLSCYLQYVDQIHRDVMSAPLLDPAARRLLHLRGWGRTRFEHGGFRFATFRVNRRVCAAQLAGEIRSGRWRGAGRLLALPLAIATSRLPRPRHAATPSWPARQKALVP